MSELKSKLEDYIKVTDLKMSYEFERGRCLEFSFQKEAFPHLIGLHKLKDIPLLARFNNPKEKMIGAKYLLGKIRQGKLTEKDICNSKYYKEIEERYQRFSFDNLMSILYTDSIVKFNVNLLKNSKLYNTKYIFYEKEKQGYRQLCIKENSVDEKYYVESFFYEKSDDYIRGQVHERINNFRIISKDGTVYLEDCFSS